MDIEELQTFIAVAASGGVSSAARCLGIAKPVVSRRLLRLETELGVRLLARTTRGAAPTEAGMAFLDYATRIVADIAAARQAFVPDGDLHGRLRIAAPISFGWTEFAPVIAELARRHPFLQIRTDYSDRMVDLVGDGYDCAIRAGHLRNSNLIARRVGSIHGKLVASPDYVRAHGAPDTPDQLRCHESLMQGTESWRFMDGETTVTVHPQGRFKADNPVALTAAAVAGLGLGYLADSLTHAHIESGALVPVMLRYPPRPAGIYIVRPPGLHPARKIRALTDVLIERFDPGR